MRAEARCFQCERWVPEPAQTPFFPQGSNLRELGQCIVSAVGTDLANPHQVHTPEGGSCELLRSCGITRGLKNRSVNLTLKCSVFGRVNPSGDPSGRWQTAAVVLKGGWCRPAIAHDLSFDEFGRNLIKSGTGWRDQRTHPQARVRLLPSLLRGLSEGGSVKLFAGRVFQRTCKRVRRHNTEKMRPQAREAATILSC